MQATKAGTSSPAGQAVRQGATQSPMWSESRRSSAIFLEARTSSESVATAIPSAAGMEQAGERAGRPSTWTAQTKQDAGGGRPSTWHRVGISIPSRRAAARIVSPS